MFYLGKVPNQRFDLMLIKCTVSLVNRPEVELHLIAVYIMASTIGLLSTVRLAKWRDNTLCVVGSDITSSGSL